MKKALIISYHFPPEGGPAVQRVAKFVKYLPQFQYQPFVLTSNGEGKIRDFSLLQDIPTNVVIKRTIDLGRMLPGDLKKMLLPRLFVPDKFALWRQTAIHSAVRLIEKEQIDLIFSTSPPHSVQLVAQQAAKMTKRPWVADFRDEWTDHPLFHQNKFQVRQQQLERQVLESCHHLTTATNTIKANFAKKIDASKITFLPNGFDPDDFLHLHSQPAAQEQRLIITYCGRLNQLHSPVLFFDALLSLIKKGPIAPDEILVNIVGNIENNKYLRSFPELNNCVHFTPYQPHATCLELMAQSTVLLLLSTNMAQTQFLPAKMFEYFYLKKPILAVVSNEGELSHALREYGNTYLGFENATESIAEAMQRLFYDWQQGKLKNQVNENFIRQFNRVNQTREMAQIFNTLLQAKS